MGGKSDLTGAYGSAYGPITYIFITQVENSKFTVEIQKQSQANKLWIADTREFEDAEEIAKRRETSTKAKGGRSIIVYNPLQQAPF